MKSTLITLASSVALTLAAALPASAQMQWTDKAFVSVNFGAQAPSQSLTSATTPDIYDEPASFASTQDVAGGAFFDIAGGYKVWENLAVPSDAQNGAGNVEVAYAGPALTPGRVYQWRATAKGNAGNPISNTEELRGLFSVQ